MEENTKRMVIAMIKAWIQHGRAIENVLQNNGLTDEDEQYIIEEVCKDFG